MKYSNDKNAQILLSLLKAHHIRKVIASPGTKNIAIVGSMQHDEYFEMYSAVDERSACYMACGLAAESGEPVAITCTGATASRNYLPGLTEAYYRKLPILVIAGSHGVENIGHLHSQVTDRTQTPKDTVRYSAFVSAISNSKDELHNATIINRALIELRRHGGGPVLIDIVASARGFDTETLPKVRAISYFHKETSFPAIGAGRIAIFVGAHSRMTTELSDAIDCFCAQHDAVVFCDHTSGYGGRYKVHFALVCAQQDYESRQTSPDLLIHIGEVSGDTYTTKTLRPKRVWRVSEDGELRDLFHVLESVFEVDELSFFKHYATGDGDKHSYLDKCKAEYQECLSAFPEMEFGNIFVAQRLASCLPADSVIHFGIFNSLRSWNFFELDATIHSSCNVGGFGIDGALSTLIGASFATPQKLHFLVVGDLAFFYDLTVLGNRHVGNNVRILLVNNGRGIEFRKKDHPGYQFGEAADWYIAAGGHFGNMSAMLVKSFAENLGFEYLTASTKEEFEATYARFVTEEQTGKPMLFEIFPEADSEIKNLDVVRHIKETNAPMIERIADTAKSGVKAFLKKIK
ncbi:MAG: 2-succinyl-5-enolpyruvyl-6-hydroxy-3-cyclohexene-1-carboxylate synthase [Bacteroidaceae bacterium]|nr:2-succinyl-5-enolpyruvyl-6-hydroxy-3-cyclohexene-1-carboxylate synthase [Bacteroidaceae bacterium]